MGATSCLPRRLRWLLQAPADFLQRGSPTVIQRLEQIAAVIVAAGLAVVSYWLFFSWAQGGGEPRRPAESHSSCAPALGSQHQESLLEAGSESAAGLEQPLLAGVVIERGNVRLHGVAAHGQAKLLT